VIRFFPSGRRTSSNGYWLTGGHAKNLLQHVAFLTAVTLEHQQENGVFIAECAVQAAAAAAAAYTQVRYQVTDGGGSIAFLQNNSIAFSMAMS
jgi:hypothetical protein